MRFVGHYVALVLVALCYLLLLQDKCVCSAGIKWNAFLSTSEILLSFSMFLIKKQEKCSFVSQPVIDILQKFISSVTAQFASLTIFVVYINTHGSFQAI